MEVPESRRFHSRANMKKLFSTLALLLMPLATLAQNQPPSVTFTISAAQQSSPLITQNWKTLPFAFYDTGTVIVQGIGVTGSPSTCTLTMEMSGLQTGTGGSGTGAASAAIPTFGNLSLTFRLAPGQGFTGPFSTAAPLFSCTTYATGGLLSIEFVPDNQPAFAAAHIATNVCTGVKQSFGQLHTLTINAAGSGETITIFDNSGATCSGTTYAIITPVAGQTYTFDNMFTSGISIQTAGTTAGDYTVTYR